MLLHSFVRLCALFVVAPVMLGPGLAGAEPPARATVPPAPAAALTMEQAKGEYASIFEVRRQQVGGRTFLYAAVKYLPPSNLLAGFVNENEPLLDYILLHGSPCGFATPGKKTAARSLAGCVEKLGRDRAFNDAVLPLFARYLNTTGFDLAGYHVTPERETFDLNLAMNIAARFFFPDSIKEDGSIQAHVCVGINGLSDLKPPRHLVLEAFIHNAINREMRQGESRLWSEFTDELKELAGLDLSSKSG